MKQNLQKFQQLNNIFNKKTDNTKNVSDNTKEDDSNNSKKNLKIFQIPTINLEKKC